MREDPIVVEVHRTRERLAVECGLSVKAVFADLRKRQAALGERLVRQPRRAAATARADNGAPSLPSKPTPTDPATAK
jgi:hypothetical protein